MNRFTTALLLLVSAACAVYIVLTLDRVFAP